MTRLAGSSLVLDCKLNSPSGTVAFFTRSPDSVFNRVMMDGIKYQRIGLQELKINNLNIDDAVPYMCEADGGVKKIIDVYVLSEYKTHIVGLLFFQPFKYRICIIDKFHLSPSTASLFQILQFPNLAVAFSK